jgi:hypothetical protein
MPEGSLPGHAEIKKGGEDLDRPDARPERGTHSEKESELGDPGALTKIRAVHQYLTHGGGVATSEKKARRWCRVPFRQTV